MKCPNCGQNMELEEYNTAFIDDGNQIELREQFWCSHCDTECTQVTRYRKEREWTCNAEDDG
jgi:hypothetical protein